MKRIILFSGSMLAVSTLFCACAHDEADAFAPAGKTVSRTFFLADTRTDYFPEENAIHFGDDEELTPFVWAADAAYANLATAKSVKRNTDGTATVEFTGDETGVYNFGFVSPASNGAQCDGSSYDVTLPGEQYPAADGSCFDRSCDVLVSRVVQENVEPVLFKRMFGFLKLTIAKSQLEGIGADERVYSVSFATGNDVALTGAATVPVTDDAAKCVPEFVTSSNKVAAVYPDGAAFDADGNLTVWFVVNPVAFEGATVEVKTSAHVYRAEYDAAAWSASLDPAKINTVAGLEFTPAEAYTAVVDGKVYSSNDEGAKIETIAANATADLALKPGAGGVYFLENNSTDHKFTSATVTVVGDLTIIGAGNEKPTYAISRYWALRHAGGTLAFKNLKIDCSEFPTPYLFNLSDNNDQIGGMGSVIFEDCEITYGCKLETNNNNPMALLTAASGNTNTLSNVIFRNCKIHYVSDKMDNGSSRYTYLINLQATGLADAGFKSMVFENNIFYMTGAVDVTNAIVSAPTRDLSGMTLTFNNNTVVDMFGFGTGVNNCAMFVFDKIGNFAVEGNLFYASTSAKYPTVMSVKTSFVSSTFPRDGQMSYSGGNATSKWKMFADSSQKPAGATTLFNTKDAANPFSTIDPAAGTFVKESAYAQYGSTLE